MTPANGEFVSSRLEQIVQADHRGSAVFVRSVSVGELGKRGIRRTSTIHVFDLVGQSEIDRIYYETADDTAQSNIASIVRVRSSD